VDSIVPLLFKLLFFIMDNNNIDDAKRAGLRSLKILLDMIYERYHATLKCTSIKSNIWYWFKQHRWIKVEGADTLYNKITYEIVPELINLARQHLIEAADHTGLEKDTLSTQASELISIVNKIANPNFKKMLVLKCKGKFFEEDFEEKIDDNPFLIGFNNGVYDLKNMCFRECTAEDMVSLSVGYDYKDYCLDDPIIEEIQSFIKVLDDRVNMREYLLTLISSCIVGIDREQHINMLIGSDPRRLAVLDLIECTFGEYYGTLPITILAKRSSRSMSPFPEFANKKGKRLLMIRDTGDAGQINIALMKEIVGSDYFACKPLYGDPIMYKPQFKVILVSGDIPTIPPYDRGTIMRSRIYKWEPVHIRDFELTRIGEYKQGFMWLLLNVYYPKYIGGVQTEPDGIRLNIHNDDQYFKEFIDMYITNSESDCEPLIQMYYCFKSWYCAAVCTEHCPARKSFANYLIDNNFKVDISKVYGVKFKWEEIKV
jgi:phage/plasmid-associated DNA primase